MLSRVELQQLLDRMADAYRAGDAQGCADMFAPDAQLHSPFGVAKGHDALVRLHEQWTQEPNAKRFSILDCGSTAEMAWCLCRFAEGDAEADGTSLLVLEKDVRGRVAHPQLLPLCRYRAHVTQIPACTTGAIRDLPLLSIRRRNRGPHDPYHFISCRSFRPV